MRSTLPLMLLLIATPVFAGEPDEAVLAKALAIARRRAAPSVVKIDTLGDLEKGFRAPRKAAEAAKGVLARKGFKQAYGPSTGVVISADGYIITSLFTLRRKPRHVFITLNDGRKFVAKNVGTDESRGIALLKIDVKKALTVPKILPKKDIRAGAFSAALGYGLGSKEPNISNGIVSAKDRVGGKAIQTSALVSPTNYGGPLIAIDGRFMGLIVPLDSAGRLAGVDFYDSGIGFAVPFSDLVKLLPRLMLGEKLEPAFLGIEADQTKVRGGITLKKVVQRSPASKAGLKEGDIITHLDGSEVKTFFELHFALGAKVAGDEIVIKYIRDGVVRETKAKLGVRKQMIGESPFGVEPGDKPGAKPKIPAVPGAPGGKKAPEEKPAKPDDGHDEHDGHDHGKEKP